MPHRRVAYLLILTLAGTVGLGCASKPKKVVALKPAPATRPVLKERPVMDISRGGAGLPVEEVSEVRSAEQLAHGLVSGLDKRLELPATREAVVVLGSGDQLDLLRIDVSDGKIRANYTPKQFSQPGKPEPAIAVKKFEYLAWPITYQDRETRWKLAASDVKFGLLKDKSGKQTLVMTDAREGTFDFSLQIASIRPMLLRAVSANGGAGNMLRDLNVSITSDNPRSLTVEMDVKALVLFIPTTVRMHARADLDRWCNVQLSELRCEGLDAGGAIIAKLAEGQIEKMNGKVLPLVKWPGDRVVLSDVQFHVDEALKINAKFEARDPDGN